MCRGNMYPDKNRAGELAAHARVRLPLLPPGPDGVHEFTLRKTRLPYYTLPAAELQALLSLAVQVL